jgi:hypothetical protein
MALTVELVAEILASGDFNRFVGEIENECFDAKDQPYPLDDPGKFEMAKDVCAFANATGGYILIGLRTQQSTVHYGDEVEKVRVMPQNLVNPTQSLNILDDWCYPPVEGLAVRFHASGADPSKGIVAIAIPRQRPEIKPFLIKRSFDGAKQVGAMFAYSERRRDGNAPLGVVDLQRALRSGLSFENKLEGRFDRIEELLAGMAAGSQAKTDTEAVARRLEERINRALGGGKSGTGP